MISRPTAVKPAWSVGACASATVAQRRWHQADGTRVAQRSANCGPGASAKSAGPARGEYGPNSAGASVAQQPAHAARI